MFCRKRDELRSANIISANKVNIIFCRPYYTAFVILYCWNLSRDQGTPIKSSRDYTLASPVFKSSLVTNEGVTRHHWHHAWAAQYVLHTATYQKRSTSQYWSFAYAFVKRGACSLVRHDLRCWQDGRMAQSVVSTGWKIDWVLQQVQTFGARHSVQTAVRPAPQREPWSYTVETATACVIKVSLHEASREAMQVN
jgi:hypothetical protein